MAYNGPRAGSRTQPDGATLRWATLHLVDDRGGVLPFFIDWGESTAHPADTAPGGLRIARLAAKALDEESLRSELAVLGVEMAVEPGMTGLWAVLSGPGGSLAIGP